MTTLRYTLFHVHKHSFLLSATILTSFFALTTVPSFIPFALHLSVLLFYAHLLNPSSAKVRIFILWIALSLVKSFHWFAPSLNALSTPFTSVLVLFVHGALTSLVTLVLVIVYARSRTRLWMHSSWTQILLFPATWATAWYALAHLSPVGYLTSWSPVSGIPAYDWLMPIFGSSIKDWLAAAWAVVISQLGEAWYMGEETVEEAPLLDQEPLIFNGSASIDSMVRNRFKATIALGGVLLALTAPSYFWYSSDLALLPRPVIGSDSTPLTVGCVLPSRARLNQHNHRQLSFEDFLAESKTMNNANILLWPEGAVSFADEDERVNALEKVSRVITSPNQRVGVSFEESYQDPADSTGRGRVLRRTGLALVSKSNETQMLYFKRNLVPIAESYRLQKSDNPPPLFTFDLKMPKWASGPAVRPISVTASICLDFAMPDPFVDLPLSTSSSARPQIILGPARTWDLAVGNAMWEQAKQRAMELDSMVLWCDGGDGGVSGIAGQGMHEVMRVGEGSWIRTIGVEYPADDHRTFYATIKGSGGTIGFMWLLVVGGYSGRLLLAASRFGNLPQNLRGLFLRWKESRRTRALSHDQEPNLLTFDD
ncbi:hypothetical protein GGU11DRAFT_762177 [Lentinula aff. detonsa]|nr:hypothetical protein GGU11DRAFT_762177 [Lentinula aff. detonsa]